MACRNLSKAQAVADEIISKTGNTEVVVRHLNLSDFNSVRKFAAEICEEEPTLHVLINNAGISGFAQKVTTPSGIELTMATNHFGPFLLTLLLLNKLKSSAPSRIINVSSVYYLLNQLDLDDVNFVKRKYFFFRAYSQSKLANILFTRELASRLDGTGVVTNCLEPGHGNTDITKHPDHQDFFHRFTTFCMETFCRTPEQAAQTQIYLAVSEEGGTQSGCYYGNCEKAILYFNGNNMKLAKHLWDASCQAVKLTPKETIPQALTHELKRVVG